MCATGAEDLHRPKPHGAIKPPRTERLALPLLRMVNPAQLGLDYTVMPRDRGHCSAIPHTTGETTMTTRITRAHLEAKARTINIMRHAPLEPYRTVNGKAVANKGNYHISGAYGGYSLHRMSNESGGASDVLTNGHTSARELAALMSAYTAGLYDASRPWTDEKK